MLESQSVHNDFDLGPDHRSHRPDCGGANGLSNRARM